MIRTDLLRKMLLEHGFTQAQAAERLGMTTRTFYNRMKNGVFRSDEMEQLADMLQLQNPLSIFFCKATHEQDAEHGRGV